MKIKECPYCGCNEFYTKERASGTMQVRHRFDGDNDVDNSDMHDNLIYKYTSKYIFCDECKKKIGTLNDVGLE